VFWNIIFFNIGGFFGQSNFFQSFGGFFFSNIDSKGLMQYCGAQSDFV